MNNYDGITSCVASVFVFFVTHEESEEYEGVHYGKGFEKRTGRICVFLKKSFLKETKREKRGLKVQSVAIVVPYDDVESCFRIIDVVCGFWRFLLRTENACPL